MFSLQLLTEALLVGVFLALALSPLVIRFTRKFADKEGLLPMAESWASSPAAIFLVLLFAYALGVSGQRVADNFFDDVAFKYCCKAVIPSADRPDTSKGVPSPRLRRGVSHIGPEQAYEDGFRNWLRRNGKLPVMNLQPPDAIKEAKIPWLKIADFDIHERSQASDDWLDHRRAYVRIDRGVAFSCLVLLISMAIYRLSKPIVRRYRASHFALVAALLVYFTCVWYSEQERYYKRVYELYIALPVIDMQPCRPAGLAVRR